MIALSIRQPWAWAIITGHKRIENRSWTTHYRGPMLIHAGARLEPVDTLIPIAKTRGFAMPQPDDLKRGGIVGQVDLVDVVTNSRDPWFDPGGYGWVLANPRELSFHACKGRLGLFQVDGVGTSK